MKEMNVHMGPVKTDEQLEKYVMFRAKKELNGKNGAVADEVVFGWARHFYEEPIEMINEEMNVKPESLAKPKSNPLVEAYKKDKAKEHKKEVGQLSLEL